MWRSWEDIRRLARELRWAAAVLRARRARQEMTFGQRAIYDDVLRPALTSVRPNDAVTVDSAVAAGELEPHEAAAVLASALAEMVAAVRCPSARAQYLRDLTEGFPAAVEVERAGVDGMVRQ